MLPPLEAPVKPLSRSTALLAIRSPWSTPDDSLRQFQRTSRSRPEHFFVEDSDEFREVESIKRNPLGGAEPWFKVEQRVPGSAYSFCAKAIHFTYSGADVLPNAGLLVRHLKGVTFGAYGQ